MVSRLYSPSASIMYGEIIDGEVCICGRSEKCIQMLLYNLERKNHSGDLGAVKRIILKIFISEHIMTT
jgi:hypothetical protein